MQAYKQNICSNCGRIGGTDDKYCKYCGSSLEMTEYVPSRSFGGVVYGPPPEKVYHKCSECGYEWDGIEYLFSPRESLERYCPKCSARASARGKNTIVIQVIKDGKVIEVIEPD